jgi:hypothetical protein
MEEKLKGDHSGNAGAGRSVYSGRNRNGHNGADPPGGKGKGRRLIPPAQLPDLPRAPQQSYDPSDQKQVRSGPIIKIIRYAYPPFVQVLQATVRDNRLSLAARGLLVYLLSLPKDWQPLMWRIREETGLSTKPLRRYMNELRKHGYAHLEQERSADGSRAIGTRWLVCEFPNPAWLKEGNSLRVPKSDCQKKAPHKNDPPLKNDRSISGSSEIRDEKKSDQSSAAGPASVHTDESVLTVTVSEEEELSLYSEEERKVIELYHTIVCAQDRSWRRVNKYTESVREVIETFFTYEPLGDTEQFFRQVLAASRCGCRNEDCEHCGAVRIPRPGRSRTLVNMSWKNY